jgi:protocatechuate 3,4-dioxygenase beta subunit
MYALSINQGPRMPPAFDRRRSVLQQSAVLASGVLVPAIGAGWPGFTHAQARKRLTPSQTEGPFYPDQALQDTDADLLKNGPSDYRSGEVTVVAGMVTDPLGQPVRGAVVEIWQCDFDGVYRHSRSSGTSAMVFQGFGKVQAGADGEYRFRTIKPVPYPGRPAHIHFKVKLGARELLTTQMYIAGDPNNARDFLFRRLQAEDRSLLEAPFSRGKDGWQARFDLVVAA